MAGLHAYICIVMVTLASLPDTNASLQMKSTFGDGKSLERSMGSAFDDLIRKRRQLDRASDLNKHGFLPEEKQLLLSIHNAYRSTISPKATNMLEIVSSCVCVSLPDVFVFCY